jgi:hypothetical protein
MVYFPFTQTYRLYYFLRAFSPDFPCSLVSAIPAQIYVSRTNTGQFKKKVTISHVYNEVTSEPTIT